MRRSVIGIVVFVAMVAMVGCTADPVPSAGCDVDDDCAAGLYCGSGGCHADCRAATDCAAMGPTAVCSARGRCESGLDGGVDGGGELCTTDAQCDDGLFCTGTEVCLPADPTADGRGCVRVAVTCDLADCNEDTDTCDPCRIPDVDHDGYNSIGCGGPDCDDSNALVNPSARELCDPAGVDEDCNPNTLGSPAEDQDADGFWPAVTPAGTPCCNGSECGTDCADVPGIDANARGRFPGATEVCNGLDDNCDGSIDNVSTHVVVDCDGDGFGDNLRLPRDGCPTPATPSECPSGAPTASWVDLGGDCNDTLASVHTGATEQCNGIDDNCDGTIDPLAPTCTCTNGATIGCGYRASNPGRCTEVIGTCRSGAWDCPVGLIPYGLAETCDEAGRDDNCNGDTDEGRVRLCADADTDGYGNVAACGLHCPGLSGYVTNDADCCDSDIEAHPGATAFHTRQRTVCGGWDFNCNGSEEVAYPSIAVDGACGMQWFCAYGAGWRQQYEYYVVPILTPPVCGETWAYDDCVDYCLVDTCGCIVSTADRTQPCR